MAQRILALSVDTKRRWAIVAFMVMLTLLTMIMAATVSASVVFFLADNYRLSLFALGPAIASFVGLLGVEWTLLNRPRATQATRS